MADRERIEEQSKARDLAEATVAPAPELTDNIGHRLSDDQNSERAGVRGPTLLEDFHFREKITHFDHERIPERVVHARGTGAHGYFQVYESLARYSKAHLFQDPAARTPVFVRFSTVAGFRGSADTARDVRGFATKFYTAEGNWDLVGNNIPVFFIQDAIKFPDLIHAVKPEPDVEMPQAASAHDTFYDFIAEQPETLHMLLWVMSDRAIPRGYQMMEGFGVHTFRLINARGESHFVKFHWKPLLGAHSLVWDEAQQIAGKDPDFHRRSLYQAIDLGIYPEYELALQIIAEGEESRFDFDILDATKIWPEDLVPVRRVGKMTLNRKPDNFFAEVEQVAFMPSNVVPGIDFSDDPLLQGRLFSYLDTQLSRLGSPNWPELPINRPLAPVSNNQRDGHMRYTINPGRVSYGKNRLQRDIPHQVPPEQGGFASYPAQIAGPKVRERSRSFEDHYGQARLFWNSMTPVEREHIARALQFELSKVETREVRQRMLEHLARINEVLGARVALALGERSRAAQPDVAPPGTADSAAETALLADATSPTSASGGLQRTAGLSQLQGQPQTPKGRLVAILAADGVAAEQAGALGTVVAPHLLALGGGLEATMTLATTSSVLFDAVFVPGGAQSVKALLNSPDARVFIDQAYKHGKPIGAVAEGLDLLAATETGRTLGLAAPRGGAEAGRAPGADAQELARAGVVIGQRGEQVAGGFLAALAGHRFWGRPPIPA